MMGRMNGRAARGVANGAVKMAARARDLPSTLTVHVPLTMHLRGGRKTVISPVPVSYQSAPKERFDNALIKAIVRAHRWRDLIEQGAYPSITELAKAECVNQSYACRLLRLTLLAPEIIDAILNGAQQPPLQLAHLLRPFPIHWAPQRTVFMKRNEARNINRF